MVQAGAGFLGQIGQGVSDYGTSKANAKIAGFEAKSARAAGAYQAGRIRDEGDRIIGETTVAQAAGGADLTSGSAALVAAESKKNSELDALMAQHRGDLGGYEKDLEVQKHKRAAKAAKMGVVGTILGGTGVGSLTKGLYS